MKIIKILLRKIKNLILLYLYKNKWRKLNSHNKTTLGNIFPLESVKVGKYTYGKLNIKSWGSRNEGLEIGNYVSIAPEVVFLLGGNHYTKTITTYPFKVMYFNETTPEALSKGKIVVGDDVWVGYRVTIMSGVNIGQGAVIAAGALVSKDVPPYAIVGGVPAKIIKYRFEPEIIKEMLKIDYSKLTKNDLINNKEKLYAEIKEKEQIDWLLNK